MPLHTQSLVAVRDALAGRDVCATEVVTSCLERIEAVDGKLGAIVPPVLAESALNTARMLDKSGPDPAKPLWGVPLAVKDCICTHDAPATCGSRYLKNFRPFYDAHAVELLRNAGAIIIAKTNMDEFAMGSTTETSAMLTTRNPWDITRVPGGSSGGSAAAVAGCEVFGALGSDTGGSIRQPAGFCGCVGIKPTYGRVSRFGLIAYASSMDQIGSFGRTVADTALLLQCIAGYDPREATSAPVPVDDYMTAVRSATDLKGIRIGMPAEFWGGNAPDVNDACTKALNTAKDLGATLVDVSLPHTRHGVAAYYILSPAEASTNLARFDGIRYGYRDESAQELLDLYVGSRSKSFGEEVKRRILMGAFVLSAGYYDAYYKKAAQVRRLIQDDYLKAFASCDLIAAPVAPTTAWPLGEHKDDPVTTYRQDALTLTLNLAGLPGISIPAGLGKESGMPVGLQLFAPAFAESALLRAAQTLFTALPSIGTPSL